MSRPRLTFALTFLTGLGIWLAGIHTHRPGITVIGALIVIVTVATAFTIWFDQRQEKS